MKKFKIEISINNANNVINTKVIEAKNHSEAMNEAEKMARVHFAKGFKTWYRAEQIRQ